MQKRGKPTEGTWWDATIDDQQPEYTGKFDCQVNDDKGGIYPAMWIPYGKDTGFGERGPGWRVLVHRRDGSGKSRPEFYRVTLIKRWLPQPPPKGKRRKAA